MLARPAPAVEQGNGNLRHGEVQLRQSRIQAGIFVPVIGVRDVLCVEHIAERELAVRRVVQAERLVIAIEQRLLVRPALHVEQQVAQQVGQRLRVRPLVGHLGKRNTRMHGRQIRRGRGRLWRKRGRCRRWLRAGKQREKFLPCFIEQVGGALTAGAADQEQQRDGQRGRPQGARHTGTPLSGVRLSNAMRDDFFPHFSHGNSIL